MGLQWQVFAEMTEMIPILTVHNEKLAHSKVKYSKKTVTSACYSEVLTLCCLAMCMT